MKFKNHRRSWLILLIFFLSYSNSLSAAEIIDLPPEELAQESVLPVFDRLEATKNRSVITEKRMEGHIFYGLGLTEAVANTSRYGLGIYYNWSEMHAFGLVYAKNSAGLSVYSNQLNSKFGLELSRAPFPDYTALLDYNYKAYYGKMSLTKMAVGNFILFFSGAAGIVKYVHKSYPAIALGLGQKFFFTKNLSLRLDFRLLGHNAPNPFKRGIIETGTAVPTYNEFEDQFDINQRAEIGLSYLF